MRDYSDTSMPDVSFYYDGKGLGSVPDFSKGKTTKVSSSASETEYRGFDIFGRLLSHRQKTDGDDYDTSYTYNLGGALIEESYPSGRVVKNTFDQDGDLTQVQSRKNSTQGFWTYASGFAHDSAGNVTKMQLGNGRWETAEYNTRQQVKMIGLGATGADQGLLKLEYAYDTSGNHDNNGSMLEQKITVPAVSATPGFTATQTYAYDTLNRIESATETVDSTETWKQEFTIDRYGNRRFVTGSGHTTTLGSCEAEVCNPTISTANNRFSSGQGYTYDEKGNVTVDAAGQRFEYDAENHQTAFYNASNETSTPDATYHYDGEGRRVKKISSTETTLFVYDGGGQLVAEYSTELAATQQVSYLTQDHLGSPRVITNESGTVTSRKDFTAFGEENVTAARSTGLGYDPASTRKSYTGYEKDEESQLEFAQARYYNPTHGRFTSVDPMIASATIKNPQTFNRYSYVLNSPYKFVDPLGLISSSTGACGGWCQNSDDSSGGGGAFDSTVGMIGIDLYYILTQSITYNVSSTTPGGNFANITVTVTRSWVTDRNGNIVAYDPRTANVSASLSNVRGYSPLQQTQIRTVAEASASAALAKGIDVGSFLGLVQGESEFGMVKTGEGPIKNALSNPTQYSGGKAKIGAWGTPDYASVLKYNLETSITDSYTWAKGKSGGNLWKFLYYWNGNKEIEKNGLEQRVNFANRVSGIINGIKPNYGGINKSGRFEQIGRPTAAPTRGVTSCTLWNCN